MSGTLSTDPVSRLIAPCANEDLSFSESTMKLLTLAKYITVRVTTFLKTEKHVWLLMAS